MSIPKGGRGKKAPYETQQMRVPLPIKDDVNKLIAAYRGLTSQQQVISIDDLESLKTEIQNLNTALTNANKEIEKLNTALDILDKENMNTALEGKFINLNTGKSQVELFDNNEEKWLTTKEAYELYGQAIKLDRFRRLPVEQLEEKFGLKGDLSKKESNKYNSRWLTKKEGASHFGEEIRQRINH